MSKVRWSCCEFGELGFVFIAADLELPGGGLLGLRQAVHPFDLDEDPQLFARTITQMTDVMGRAGAQSLPASRVRAFGA